MSDFEPNPKVRQAKYNEYLAQQALKGCQDKNSRLEAEITRLCAENAKLREAVELTEKSEDEWANCPECQETLRLPELCERCITLADQARLARRAALQETGDDA